jgi:hypothetical protein
MWRFCCWVYARLYLRTQRKWPGESASWSAVSGLAFTMIFHALSLLVIITWAMGSRFPVLGVLAASVLVVSITAFIAWRFIRRGDADDLIRQMSKESPEEARRASMQLWAYIIGSPAVAFLLALILL